MSEMIYAIGDVHGRDDLLRELHEHIASWHQLIYPEAAGTMVHLGDYIDGGSQSIGVIDRVMRGLAGFKTVNLLGNHEAMMLDCLDSADRQVWHTWLSNGGAATLDSLGVSLRFGGYDPTALHNALGTTRIDWLRSLPLYHVAKPYLFVHAGIVPGIPVEKQNPKDLLWIRSRFIESDADHGHIVVHGHTPGDDPVLRSNRICVDTGATSNGILTAAVLDGRSDPVFLRASGPPG